MKYVNYFSIRLGEKMLKTWWGEALPFKRHVLLVCQSPRYSLPLINTNHARVAHHILSRTPAMRTNENTVWKSSNLEHSGKYYFPSFSHCTQDRQSSKWKGQKPETRLPSASGLQLSSYLSTMPAPYCGRYHRTGLVLMDLSCKEAHTAPSYKKYPN